MRGALLAVILLLVAGCASRPPPVSSPTPSAEPFECPRSRLYREGPVNLTIDTSKGEIGIQLRGDLAPITVCNLLRYVEEDYYDGTIWHRICTHVIQTGGYNPYTGAQKQEHAAIRNEANISLLRNLRATLGMAREAEPHSARSHFYVNLKDNTYLDWDGRYPHGYAVFGNVTSGWSVVQDIADTPTEEELEGRLPPGVPYGVGCDGRPVPIDQTTIRDIRLSPAS